MSETEQTVKYPEIKVQLGEYGDGYYLLANVSKQLRAQVGIRVAEEWYDEAARAESYDALLQLVMRTVTTHGRAEALGEQDVPALLARIQVIETALREGLDSLVAAQRRDPYISPMITDRLRKALGGRPWLMRGRPSRNWPE